MTTEQFWIYTLSVLISPLLAVQVTMMIQRKRERRDRQRQVFRSLMRTRASGLAPDHVQALNMVDIEFYGTGRKERAVLGAWKAYVDHMNLVSPDLQVWGSRREDLLIELLYAMGRYLSYDFDKTDIRRTSYFPRGYGEAENDLLRIRKGFAEVADGKRALPVTIYDPPSSTPSVDQRKQGV